MQNQSVLTSHIKFLIKMEFMEFSKVENLPGKCMENYIEYFNYYTFIKKVKKHRDKTGRNIFY
jgi:hypothetical protein